MIDLTQFTPWNSLYGSWIHFDTSIGWQIHTSQGKTDTTIIHPTQLDRRLARTGVRT